MEYYITTKNGKVSTYTGSEKELKVYIQENGGIDNFKEIYSADEFKSVDLKSLLHTLDIKVGDIVTYNLDVPMSDKMLYTVIKVKDNFAAIMNFGIIGLNRGNMDYPEKVSVSNARADVSVFTIFTRTDKLYRLAHVEDDAYISHIYTMFPNLNDQLAMGINSAMADDKIENKYGEE